MLNKKKMTFILGAVKVAKWERTFPMQELGPGLEYPEPNYSKEWSCMPILLALGSGNK